MIGAGACRRKSAIALMREIRGGRIAVGAKTVLSAAE
jgi:hypothetical protein